VVIVILSENGHK